LAVTVQILSTIPEIFALILDLELLFLFAAAGELLLVSISFGVWLGKLLFSATGNG
jgi:hypothetical protein